MVEYIYYSRGAPLKDCYGDISLPREKIVRCSDCAYILHREYNNGFKYYTCSYFDSEHAEVELNGFCAWGQMRKEGETQMKAFMCDECGEFYTYAPNKIAHYYDDNWQPVRKVELCHICYASIKKVLPKTFAMLDGDSTENEG